MTTNAMNAPCGTKHPRNLNIVWYVCDGPFGERAKARPAGSPEDRGDTLVDVTNEERAQFGHRPVYVVNRAALA
jgi:hypothetical protein